MGLHATHRRMAGWRWFWKALWVGSLLGALTANAHAETLALLAEEELYQEVFGKQTREKPQALTAEIHVDGEMIGFAHVRRKSPSATEFYVAGDELVTALDPLVRDEPVAQIKNHIQEDGFVAAESLRALGFEAMYDNSTLIVFIYIPPDHRRVVVNALGTQMERPVVLAGSPGQVSGYLNVRVGDEVLWASHPSLPQGRGPLNSNVAGALNVKGWVFEGSGRLSEQRELWQRGDLRVVHDLPSQAIRFSAGELSIPGSSFQSSLSILGASWARNFSLDPQLPVLPEEAVNFFLQRRSRVQVLVNGRLVQTLELSAGPQNLRRLLLEAGSNEVELLITDDLGRQERVTKRIGLSSGQLAPGVSEYTYAAGIVQDPSALNLSRSYDIDRPMVHLSHRRGLTDFLTLRGFLQADPQAQSVGVEPLWVSSLGNFSARAATSLEGSKLGYGLGLQYEQYFHKQDLSRLATLGLGVEYRSAAFATPGTWQAQLETAVLRGTFMKGFGLGWSGRMSTELLAQGRRLLPGGALGITTMLANGLSMTGEVFGRALLSAPAELVARLHFSWAWPFQGRSVQAQSEVGANGSARVQVSGQQYLWTRTGYIQAIASVGQQDNAQVGAASLNYRNQRAEFFISNQLQTSRGTVRGMTNVLQANMGTAVVLADGVFAWSRPIVAHSFAVVLPNRALQGQFIGVNPTRQGYSGVVDSFGPAVLPDLQPYQINTLKLDAPDLPIGYSLGDETLNVRASYGQGLVLRVGEEGTVYLRGTLTDSAGAPLSLQSGTVLATGGVAQTPRTFFTNRKGRFVVTGLKPGTYVVRMAGSEMTGLLEIPENHVGEYSSGPLRLQEPVIPGSRSLEVAPSGAGEQTAPAEQEVPPEDEDMAWMPEALPSESSRNPDPASMDAPLVGPSSAGQADR